MKPRFHPEFYFACAFTALAFAAVFVPLRWDPYVAFPDELANLQWLQEWKEGQALPLSFAKGSLHRWLLALITLCFGPSTRALHLLAPIAFLIECLLLYKVASRLFGEKAGSWALVANASAAFTWIRLRSLLSYTLLPLELLLVLWLVLAARGRKGMALAGLLAAVFLLDYDAWVLAPLPLAWMAWKREGWAALKPAALGFLAGLVGVLALSWQDLLPYVQVRLGQNVGAGPGANLPHLWNGLKVFWTGGQPLEWIQVAGTPAFPAWAWLPLLLSVFVLPAGRRWIGAWCLLGFLPFLSRNSELEPQRAILAWPALCLAAGYGAAWMGEARTWMPWLLAVAAAGLGMTQARLLDWNRRPAGAYAPAWDLAEAAREMKGKAHFLYDLDSEPGGAWRFLLGSGDGERVAVVPKDFIRRRQGMRTLGEGGSRAGRFELMALDAGAGDRLEAVERELREVWRGMPRFDARGRRRAAVRYLSEHPQADPWVRTALLEHAIGQSFLLGEFPVPLIRQLEAEPMESGAAMLWAAAKLKAADPAWARRLETRALGAAGAKPKN